MVDKAGTKTSYYSSSGAIVTSRRPPLQRLAMVDVVFSAEQKQQLHHQQLTNGSTILKMFTFLVNLDLFHLSNTVSFGSILANIS